MGRDFNPYVTPLLQEGHFYFGYTLDQVDGLFQTPRLSIQNEIA